MPILNSDLAILIGFIVAPAVFVLCAYFTRAGLRPPASGLAGSWFYFKRR